MKKRMIALVAVFAMAVGMLGGCGNNNSADAGKDNAVSAAGEPMLGGIDDQKNYDTLMKQIQSVIDADSANK